MERPQLGLELTIHTVFFFFSLDNKTLLRLLFAGSLPPAQLCEYITLNLNNLSQENMNKLSLSLSL